jgi:poly(beta-D-mannuronate) lyase
MQNKNMKILFFYVLALFCVLFVAISGKLYAFEDASVEITLQENREFSTQNSLRSPYPSIRILSSTQDGLVQNRCPKTPKAVRELKFQSIYTDKSQGTSIVDKNAQKKYRQQVKHTKSYEQKIEQWVADALQGKQKSAKGIKCTIQWLYDWARQDSFLRDNKPNFQGEAVRKWVLSTLASHYVQIKDISTINQTQKAVVDDWFSRMAKQVIRDYNRYPESKSRNSNHMYWAAWGVVITGVALDDRDFYNWGLKHFKKAMHHMNEDGTLPLELFRERKAFNYHLFAGAPLTLMAETFTVNGDNMYRYNNNAMHRFVDFVMDDIENDQALVTKLTGRKQDLTGSLNGGQLAWLEVYNARFPNDRINNYLQDFRPAKQRRLGGNLTYLFSAY